MVTAIQEAYIIGQDNFNAWSPGYDTEGYLKVLPQHKETVSLKDPYKQWQLDHQNGTYKEEGAYTEGGKSVYYSSWGPDDTLEVTLDMQYLSEIDIPGFGKLKAGDGFIPWFNEETTAYEFLRAYNGLIPGPLLVADPGDTIKITLINNLKPSSVAPSAPEQVTNLHTHGLHVSPVGAGDNVLVTVESGETREISIKLPENHAIGLDWYHPHFHGVTSEQVASGLGGLLAINPAYNLPDLDKFNPTTAPFYTMAINTFGIQQQLRTPNPEDPLNKSPDSTVTIPAGTPLENMGDEENPVYELSDAVFGGYNAKPASYDPTQPLGNPEFFIPEYGAGGLSEPVENVIHTVNGQYNPTIENVQTGVWSVFSFANMSINSFHVIQLVHDDGNGNLTPETVTLISIDGNASGIVEGSRRDVTQFPVLAPGARVAIQHAFTKSGTYYFLSNGTEEILDEDYVSDLIKGKKGFEDGHLIWAPQVLATVEVEGPPVAKEDLPDFPEPFDVLVEESQKINEIVEAAKTGDVTRERDFIWDANVARVILAGGTPSDTDVSSFEGVYTINGRYYSTKGDGMPPLAMPMLGTKEIWNIINRSGLPDESLPFNIPLSEWHPFHIHQNDFVVLEINGIPVEDIEGNYLPGVLSDTISLPPAYVAGTATAQNPYGTPFVYDPQNQEVTGVASEVKIAISFEDYPGSYVNHCHILFHEDAGMMAVLRVILNTEDTWIGLGVDEDAQGEIELFRANDYEQGITLKPYGEDFSKGIDLAIADVGYKFKNAQNQNVTDNVTDIITIQRSLESASDHFMVKIFDGQGLKDAQETDTEVDADDEDILLTEITPFQDLGITPTTEQIASVASGDIDGDGYADIVVGLGGGVAPIIEIYSGKDHELISRISAFHHETFTGKINLAVGDINGDNYDDVIVGQGEGGRGLVEVFSGILIQSEGSLVGKDTAHATALLTKEFQPYGPDYTGEVDVTSGYVLQRPDTPNDFPTQTNNANLTTLAKGNKPDDYDQIQVFTYTGGGHGEHSSSHSSNSDEEEMHLDYSVTLAGNTQEILGTFADLEGYNRGEPVMLTRRENGQYDIVYLAEENEQIAFTFGEANNQGEEPEEEVTEIIKDDDKDIFTIKGGVNGKVKIKISIEEYSSSFVNELAIFVVDGDDGNIGGILPGASGYAEAALARARVVLSSIANRPNGFSLDGLSSLLEFNSDVKVRFMSINNSTLESVISGFTSISEVLFSESYQTIESLTSGEFSLKWKDKSDKSSFKLKIKATNESYINGSRLQAEFGREILEFKENVTAEFKVYREARFNNFVGFYRIANENGDIDVNDDQVIDFRPGDAGYLQAAVNLYLQQIRLTVSNQGEATYQGNFNQGLFAPFIIADGSVEDVLDGGDIPPVYFAFLGANPGQADHIRLLGNNCFGFEDLPNGASDRDYNDVIVKINVNVNVG